jgi:hypothetical protein
MSGCLCPDCQRALQDVIKSNEMEAVAIAWIAERYGFDDLDARIHLIAHAHEFPEMIQ